MSKTTIAEKALEIRNETREKANTRIRVADVIDDINLTKVDKTLETISAPDSVFKYAYILDEENNTRRMLAGDLGKNVANSNLTSVMGAGLQLAAPWTIGTNGFPYKITDLSDKSADATYDKLLAINPDGFVAKSDGRTAFLKIPSKLTDAEKNIWKTEMNGGWTTASMSVYMLIPFVIPQGQDLTSVITLLGANLNLNPASFKIEICTADSTGASASVVMAINNSAVNLVSSSEINFFSNLKNLPAGSYKIRLWNGVAFYLTDQTFIIIPAENIQNINVNNITWEKVFDSNVQQPAKSYAAGNVIHTELESYSGTPSGGLVPIFSFKSNLLALANENICLEFDLTGFAVGGNTLPLYGMHIGLGDHSLNNQLSNLSDFYVAIGRHSYDRYDGYIDGVFAPLAGAAHQNQAKLIILKQANKISISLYNSNYRAFKTITLNSNTNTCLFATGYYKTFTDSQLYTLTRAYKF